MYSGSGCGVAQSSSVTRDGVEPEPGVTVHRDVKANSLTLRQLYATSDIFVLPTQADCFSLVCMEALAAGLPVVTTKVGGIPDIVLDGKTGRLLEAGDSAALGDALEMLVTDPACGAKWGRTATQTRSFASTRVRTLGACSSSFVAAARVRQWGGTRRNDGNATDRDGSGNIGTIDGDTCR